MFKYPELIEPKTVNTACHHSLDETKMVNIQATNQSCLNNSFVDESKTVTPQTPNNIPHSSSAESQASVRSPSNHPSMDETQCVQSQCLNHDSLDRTQNVNPSFSSQSPQRFPNMTTSICTNFQTPGLWVPVIRDTLMSVHIEVKNVTTLGFEFPKTKFEDHLETHLTPKSVDRSWWG